MTADNPSRTASPSLADVLQEIAGDHDLPDRRRQDVCSALRTFAKALGQAPDLIPAHPGHLRQILKKFTPVMAGLTPRRWHNTLSLVRFALAHAGLAHVPGRYREPMAPAWESLYSRVRNHQMRVALSRFFRYCTVKCIAPEEVNDAVLARYHTDLSEGGLIAKPQSLHRTVSRFWNAAADAIPDWPQQRVTLPDYRNTYALPWDRFPVSLKAEIDAWLDRLAGKDILADLDFRPLRPASLRSRSRLIHEYVSALVHRGRDPASLRSMADLVALDTLKEGVRFFLDRAGGKPNLQCHDIACVIRVVARHWVKVPKADLDQIKALCRRVNPGRGGMTVKNQGLIRKFDDPQNVYALVTLPDRIFAEVPRTGGLNVKQSLAVQTALAIEILLMVPMRLGNLASLHLEKNILRTRGGLVHLAIRGTDVKNGMDIEAELPAQTVRLLDLYLERCRPVLADQPSAWLFPGRGGTGKGDQSLRAQITDCVRTRCGITITPHQFRHVAAKLYLDANPGAYGVLRLTHGHKSVDTTTKFYCGMETPATMRHFDEHILKLKAEAPPSQRKGR